MKIRPAGAELFYADKSDEPDIRCTQFWKDGQKLRNVL
jgi:hypothetical protein